MREAGLRAKALHGYREGKQGQNALLVVIAANCSRQDAPQEKPPLSRVHPVDKGDAEFVLRVQIVARPCS